MFDYYSITSIKNQQEKLIIINQNKCLEEIRMLRSSIFVNREKLSPRYIPSILPHRKKQIDFLFTLYEDAFEHIEKVFLRVTQIVGDVGTGKTCTVTKFGEKLEKEASHRKIKFQHIYLNCKIEGTSRFVLYGSMLGKVAPEISTRSLSPEEMLQQLVKYLRDQEKYIFISVDEVDYFYKRSKEHIIYDLTRLPELIPGEPSPIIGEIFISRDLAFKSRLDPSEVSTLGRGIIEFPRYTAQQIKDILEQRVEEAFRAGVVDEGVLEFISDVAARPPVNGDIRVALDLLLFSGILAGNQGSKKVLPDHARKVYSQTNPDITTQDILDLDETEKLVLLGLVRSLQSQKAPYVSLKDIREGYLIVCEEYELKPTKEIEDSVQDLWDRGIVDMKSLTEFGISGVSTQDLENFLNGITERLRRGLNEEKKTAKHMGRS
jgi:cell division control protein 6